MKDIEKLLLEYCKKHGAYPRIKNCFLLTYTASFQCRQLKIIFTFKKSKNRFDDIDIIQSNDFDSLKKLVITKYSKELQL